MSNFNLLNNKVLINNTFIDGSHEYKFPNGDCFYGNCKNDMKYGKGMYMAKNQNKYIGNWENDKLKGRGMWYDINGNYYYGDFDNNKMNGKGVFRNNHHKDSYFYGDW